MLGYQKKNITLKALDVDTSSRRVKVAISQMNSKDRDGDIIISTAFNKTIKEKGPQGANEIWHLMDHRATLSSALSKYSEIWTENDYLIGVSEYRNSFAWREIAWPAYEAGDITQHSIGFSIVDSVWQKDSGKDIRIIKEIALWEGSAVLWGANPNTPTLEVAKSLGIYTEDMEPGKRIEQMIKALKSDKFDAEAKELFIIELQQIYQDLKDLGETTKPPGNGTEPVKGANFDLIALHLLSTQKNY